MSAVATPRDRQVEKILGERETQVERFERLRELVGDLEHEDGYLWPRTDLRTHHGWGVCVKVRDVYCTCENYAGPGPCDCGYDQACRAFWQAAERLALDGAFQGVYAEGRQSGYLLVSPQPDLDNLWEHEVEEYLYNDLGPFVLEVLELLEHHVAAWKRGEPIF